MTRGAVLLMLAIGCAALGEGAVRAEPPAADHYEIGKRLFERKRYAEALEEFRRAIAVEPRPEVLYALGQAQRMLGDCPSAIETYRAFLAGLPGEPLAEYARANIERCERAVRSSPKLPPRVPPRVRPPVRAPVRPPPPEPAPPAWYHDTVGDALVGGGLVVGVAGMALWRSGRAAADHVAAAPDYQTFLRRRSAASSALTEQRIGIAAAIAGGAAIVGGIAHYVHHGRSHHERAIGVTVTSGGALIVGAGQF